MNSSTEKAIWRSRADTRTKTLLGRESQLHHCRRSDLAKDTEKHIVPHANLARGRYSDKFGGAAWDQVGRADVVAEKRRKSILQQRRRRERALAAVVEETRKVREEASKATEAQRIARLRRLEVRACREKKDIIFKLQSSAAMGSELAPKRRKARSASFPDTLVGKKAAQAARSVTHLLTPAKQVTHNSNRIRSRSYPGFSNAKKVPILDPAADFNSKERQKSAPLPSRPPIRVNSIDRLPALAQLYDQPLSAARLEYNRKRMRQPREDLGLGPGQRDKAMTDELSVASKSMSRAFNRSIKFTGNLAETAKQEHPKQRGKTTPGDQRILGSAEDDVLRIASSAENGKSVGEESKNMAACGLNLGKQAAASMSYRPTRARGNYSDNSFLSKRTKFGDSLKHKRRTKSAPSSLKSHHAYPGQATRRSKDATHLLQRRFSIPKAAQNESESANGGRRARCITSLSRENLAVGRLPTKRKRSSIHDYAAPRFSQRLSHLQQRTKEHARADTSLEYHAGKKRKISNNLEPPITRRLRSSIRYAAGTEEQELPGGGQAPDLPKAPRASRARRVTGVARGKPTVKIPADTDMATDLRTYRQWPGRYILVRSQNTA